MKCYIIGSAPGTDLATIKQINKDKGDLVVCADGGYEYATAAGLNPDFVVGDFDSAKRIPPKGDYEIVKFDKDKDFTDARLAVDIGLKKGYKDFELYACAGGRFDHMYANILILLMLSKNGCQAKMIDNDCQYYFIDKDLELTDKRRRTVSLFAVADTVEGITLEGFKYPLNDYTYTAEDSIGISNVITANNAIIKLKKGNLLVVEYNKEF